MVKLVDKKYLAPSSSLWDCGFENVVVIEHPCDNLIKISLDSPMVKDDKKFIFDEIYSTISTLANCMSFYIIFNNSKERRSKRLLITTTLFNPTVQLNIGGEYFFIDGSDWISIGINSYIFWRNEFLYAEDWIDRSSKNRIP